MKQLLLRPKVIGWFLVILLTTIIVLQNAEPISMRILFWSFAAMPKLFLILASMLFGSLLTLVIVWQWKRPKKSSTGDGT